MAAISRCRGFIDLYIQISSFDSLQTPGGGVPAGVSPFEGLNQMYTAPKNVYRDRVDFSKIKTSIPIPNLIEIQKNSYERFLQMRVLAQDREDAGLQSVFKSVFPIHDLRENCALEFAEYSIGNWE